MGEKLWAGLWALQGGYCQAFQARQQCAAAFLAPLCVLPSQRSLICLPSRGNISSWTQKFRPSMDKRQSQTCPCLLRSTFAIWEADMMQPTVDPLTISIKAPSYYYYFLIWEADMMRATVDTLTTSINALRAGQHNQLHESYSYLHSQSFQLLLVHLKYIITCHNKSF